MLPKANRLRAEKDIKKVFKKGRRMMTPLFRFQILQTNAEQTRFAVVVSTKVAKRATVRNLIKRRVRESLREILETVPKGYDVVIQARTASITYTKAKVEGQKTPPERAASYKDVMENMKQLISKLN
ncbi:MAG: ribonuclease P protein component [Parcubacteria group bacterium]|nr:ribonuclease P protein component [Parcubacteria group bacterium]